MIENFCNSLSKCEKLDRLSLDFSGIGNDNSLVTSKSVKNIGDLFGKLPKLKFLGLNLHKW
jgi:hypothetical protein